MAQSPVRTGSYSWIDTFVGARAGREFKPKSEEVFLSGRRAIAPKMVYIQNHETLPN